MLTKHVAAIALVRVSTPTDSVHEIIKFSMQMPPLRGRLPQLWAGPRVHMTLEEMLNAIEQSDSSEWTYMDRPVFPQDIQQVSGLGQKVPWLEISEHHSLLSFRSDLRISIALGLPETEDFDEPWAKMFPNAKASSSWVDFRYNGVAVLRELRVVVDGGRAGMPLPNHDSEVAERHYNIWALIDEVAGSGDLGDYFKRAGLKIVKAQWPVRER